MTKYEHLDKVFKNGSKEEIKKAIMDETKINKNYHFAGKGLFLLTVIIDCLTDLREREKFDLNVNSYNEYLDLKNLMLLTDHNKLPLEDVFKVKNYLKHLPGFNEKDNFFNQKDVVKSQHDKIKESIRLK